VGSPGSPGIPARNGFNGFLRALPGDRLVATVACVMKRKLDTSIEASGPHDFAVRLQHRSSAVLSASIASRPASVTIAIRPFGGTRRRYYRTDLGRDGNEIFLQMGLDRQITDLPRRANERTCHGRNGRASRTGRVITSQEHRRKIPGTADLTNYEEVDRTCQNLSKRCAFSVDSPAN
jgi:hypothetical protein